MRRNSEGSSDQEHHEDEISLIQVVNVLLLHRRWIILIPLALSLLVAGRALRQQSTYEASASFMPQIAEGRSGSAAAGLARQFGIGGVGERPGQSPTFYADLVQSRELLRQAVSSEYVVTDEDGQRVTGTLIELYGITHTGSTPQWWRAVSTLRNSLAVSVDRTGVVRVSVTAFSPEIAEQILERLLFLVHDFNLQARQDHARDESRFVLERMSEAESELLGAEANLQRFLQTNREFRNSPELVFEHDRLQRQVTMRQEIYTSLVQAHQQARIDAVRDTPLLTVIDQPAGSRVPQGRGARRRVMVTFVLGAMFASLSALVVEYARRTRRKERDDYREFDRLTREALADIRWPLRWVPRRTRASTKVAPK